MAKSSIRRTCLSSASVLLLVAFCSLSSLLCIESVNQIDSINLRIKRDPSPANSDLLRPQSATFLKPNVWTHSYIGGRMQKEAEEERLSDIELPEYSEEENDTGLGAGRRKTDFDAEDNDANRKFGNDNDFRRHHKPIGRSRGRSEGSINRRTQSSFSSRSSNATSGCCGPTFQTNHTVLSFTASGNPDQSPGLASLIASITAKGNSSSTIYTSSVSSSSAAAAASAAAAGGVSAASSALSSAGSSAYSGSSSSSLNSGSSSLFDLNSAKGAYKGSDYGQSSSLYGSSSSGTSGLNSYGSSLSSSQSGSTSISSSHLLSSSASISSSSSSSSSYVDLVSGLRNQTRFSGQKAHLRCVFEAQTKPRIRWLKNEAPLETQVSSSKVHLQEQKLSSKKYEARLRINDLDTHDSGFYKCRASLPHGKVSESVGVLVVTRVQIDERTSDHRHYSHSSSSSSSTSIGNEIEGIDEGSHNEPDLDQITNEITPPIFPDGSIKHTLDETDNVGISFVPNTPNLPLVNQGITEGLARCVPYTGSVCSQYLQNRTVVLRAGHTQNQMEMLLRRAFAIVASSASISPQCHRFTVPLLCYQSFQVCEQKEVSSSSLPELGINEKDEVNTMYHAKQPFQLRQLCRDECEILEQDVCSMEFTLAKLNPEPELKSLLPTCQNLPRVGEQAYCNCLRIGVTQDFYSPLAVQKCYDDNGANYRGNQFVTRNGRTCEAWSSVIRPSLQSPELSGSHNFCRNPKNVLSAPWCYVKNEQGQTLKELCDIPKCDDHFWIYWLLTPALAAISLLLLLLCIFCIRRMFGGKRADSGRTFNRSLSQGPTMFPYVYAPNSEMDERSPCLNEKNVALPHDSNPHMKQLSNALVGYRANGLSSSTATHASHSNINNQLELQSLLHHSADSSHLNYNERRCGTATSGQYALNTSGSNSAHSSLSNQRAQLAAQSSGALHQSHAAQTGNNYIQREISSQISTQQIGQSSLQMSGQFTSQLVQYSSGGGSSTPTMHITSNPIDSQLMHFSSKQVHFLNRLHGRHGSIGSVTDGQPRMSLNHQFYSGQLTGLGASASNAWNETSQNNNRQQTQNVQIRVMHLQPGKRNQQLFLQQAEQLSQLKHSHVQSLLGVCLAGQQYNASANYLIFEQYSNTSLLQFLQQQQVPAAGQQPLCSATDSQQYRQLINIAQQIASGMSYLSSNGYLHGDLAARNCWVRTTGNGVQVKVGGLRLQPLHMLDSDGRRTQSNEQIVSQLPRNESQLDEPDYFTLWPGEPAIPVRWLSPETLQSRTWSSATDVWSFGVLLWELVTYGRQVPFESQSNAQAADSIIAGRLLDCPSYCEPQLHALMLDCWRELPTQRLTFEQVCRRLTQLVNNTANANGNVANQSYGMSSSNMMYSSDKCISSAASTGYGSGGSSGGSGAGVVGGNNLQSYNIAVERNALNDQRQKSTSVGEYEQPFVSIEQSKNRSSRNQTIGGRNERACQQQATFRTQTQSGNAYESHYAKISYEDEETESVRSFHYN